MQILGVVDLASAPGYLRQMADMLDNNLAAIREGIPIHGKFALRKDDDLIKWSFTREESDGVVQSGDIVVNEEYSYVINEADKSYTAYINTKILALEEYLQGITDEKA